MVPMIPPLEAEVDSPEGSSPKRATPGFLRPGSTGLSTKRRRSLGIGLFAGAGLHALELSGVA